MEEINFIVIEKKKDTQQEMHVFTNDGKEATYTIFDGKNPIKSSYMQLKQFAEKKGVKFSSAGLRELRAQKQLYYMGEEEFARVHETMSQGNKNQAQYQKEKKQSQQEMLIKERESIKEEKCDYLISKEEQKINHIVIKTTKDKKADMHVFMDDGEEVVYPIYDGKELVKSNYVQLKKLAEQNGIEFSSEGLKNLKESRLLQYMTEEKFAKVHGIISQEDTNQANDQEKKLSKQFTQEYKLINNVFPFVEISQASINSDNKSQGTVIRESDDLDSSKIKVFMTHEEEKREELAKDSNESLEEEKGISYQLKKVAIAGFLTAMIGAAGFHFGTKSNNESSILAQNTKTIESTMTPINANTNEPKADNAKNQAQEVATKEKENSNDQKADNAKNQAQEVATKEKENSNDQKADNAKNQVQEVATKEKENSNDKNADNTKKQSQQAVTKKKENSNDQKVDSTKNQTQEVASKKRENSNEQKSNNTKDQTQKATTKKNDKVNAIIVADIIGLSQEKTTENEKEEQQEANDQETKKDKNKTNSKPSVSVKADKNEKQKILAKVRKCNTLNAIKLREKELKNLKLKAKDKLYKKCPLSAEVQQFIYEQSIINKIPADWLFAVIYVESGGSFRSHGAVHRNTNGTEDYGLTQQNSKEPMQNFQKVYKIKDGKTAKNLLRYNDYANICSAFLEVKEIRARRKAYNAQEYAGCYNGWLYWRNNSTSLNYVKKFNYAYNKIFTKHHQVEKKKVLTKAKKN